MASWSWNLVQQVFACFLALAMVAIFLGLHYKEILFTPKYGLRLTQQITNFITTIITTVVVAIISNCLLLTNEAETTAQLAVGQLKIETLWHHWAVVTKSWSGMRRLPFYLISALLFLTIPTVFSAISVVDIVLVRPQYLVNVTTQPKLPKWPVILGAEVGGGDACGISITSENCTYDRVIGPMSSNLIANTPYEIAGFTFNQVNGTNGIPYDILKQFAANSSASSFADGEGHFCLPSLDKQMVSCMQDTSNTRVSYDHRDTVNGMGVEYVTINPNSSNKDIRVRVNYQNGTMTIARSRIQGEENITIITGTGIYANLLYQLSYGPSNNSTENVFTTICTIKSVNEGESWKWTRLIYGNNSFRAEIPDSTFPADQQNCESGLGKNTTGFIDLFFAIEGASRLVNGADGYSKYLTLVAGSENWNLTTARNTTRLEFILTEIYHITQTIWSSTNPADSTQTSIIGWVEEHKYRFHAPWAPFTITTFLLAISVCAAILKQAWHWLKLAQTESNEYNLLNGSDLFAYCVEGATRLRPYLNVDHDVPLPPRPKNSQLSSSSSGSSVANAQPGLDVELGQLPPVVHRRL